MFRIIKFPLWWWVRHLNILPLVNSLSLFIFVIFLLLNLTYGNLNTSASSFSSQTQNYGNSSSLLENRPQWIEFHDSSLWTSKRHRLNSTPTSDNFANEILRTRQSPTRRKAYRAKGVAPGILETSSRRNTSQYLHKSDRDLFLAFSSQNKRFPQSKAIPTLHTRTAVPRRNQKVQQKKRHHHRGTTREHETKKRPNIILILTDDLDSELGSMNYMPKTMEILSRGGVHAKNAFVTTPMCCPSRSSILTGLYAHNHNVYTNGENCSSSEWQKTHERHTFATYLQDSGYRTGFFGKYLNLYNGTYQPPGWSHWSALVRNSKYYNYTLNVNGDRQKHGSDYQLDYLPDLILNDSLQYMRFSKRFYSSKPFLIVMSFPSPHGPEDAAPQFQNMFLNEKGHRTKSWNYAPNQDKQWLLRQTPSMGQIEQNFTDFLNSKRLQTLQSVDNAVYQIYTELKTLEEIDRTFILFFSDNGYHLGQFGLVKGKGMPFEFDVKIPLYIRGPGVPANQILPQIVLNIDLAPTFLDIAGITVPPQMDGTSFIPFIRQLNNASLLGNQDKMKSRSKRQKPHIQRDSFLIEKGKFNIQPTIDRLLIPIIGKKQWLQMECQKPEYQSPCKMFQKFECIQDGNGTNRIRKCHRGSNRTRKHYRTGECFCPNRTASSERSHDLYNKARPRPSRLNKRRANKIMQGHRVKRSDDAFSALVALFHDDPMLADPNGFDVEGVYELKKLIDLAKSSPSSYLHDIGDSNESLKNAFASDIANITTSELVSIMQHDNFSDLSNYTDYLNQTFCTVARVNLSIVCTEEMYHTQEYWKEKKDYIDSAIRQLQRRLFELKGIRRYMIQKRPIKERVKHDRDSCLCDKDWQTDFRQSDLLQKLPRRHVERRFMKHLQRKKIMRKKEKKTRRKEKFENTACEMAANEQMNCFTHDNHHWKEPPKWKSGPFCFCQNSLNNSFWCMRTINETHNFLYCEFVTGFIIYFDINKDPFQLRNAIFELEFATVEQLSRDLARLKSCSGSQCSLSNKSLVSNSGNASLVRSEKAGASQPNQASRLSATQFSRSQRLSPFDWTFDT